MKIKRLDTEEQVGRKAAMHAAVILKEAISQNGQASIVLGTGASQFEILKNLTAAKDISWHQVNMFHLDEYIGLKPDHPASFCRYLQERFINQVGKLKSVNYILGNTDNPQVECRRLTDIISSVEIDVSLIGIGENGHLAFNDPPADFETQESFVIVNLDEACRQQQVGEGWFGSLQEVPEQAITMTIPQIMKSKNLIGCVLDSRKATTAQKVLEGELTNLVPASILRQHPNCTMYFDPPAASLLSAVEV